MRVLFIVLSVLAGFVLSSCEKGSDESPGQGENRRADGKRVSQEIVKYDNNPFYEDAKREYDYQNGRIVAERYFELQSSTWIPSHRSRYEYDGNKVIVTLQLNENLIEWEDYAKREYIFEGNRLVQYDRYGYDNGWTLAEHIEYDYIEGRLSVQKLMRYDIGSDTLDRRYEYEYDKGLLKAERGFSLNHNSEYILTMLKEYEYEGDKPTDMMRLGVNVTSDDTTYTPFWSFVYEYMGEKLERKRVKYLNEDGHLVSEESENYIYDQAGYLIEVVYEESMDTNTQPQKRIYEYEQGSGNIKDFNEPLGEYLPDPHVKRNALEDDNEKKEGILKKWMESSL